MSKKNNLKFKKLMAFVEEVAMAQPEIYRAQAARHPADELIDMIEAEWWTILQTDAQELLKEIA